MSQHRSLRVPVHVLLGLLFVALAADPEASARGAAEILPPLVGIAELRNTGADAGKPPCTLRVEAWVGGKITTTPATWVWDSTETDPGTASSPAYTREQHYTCAITGTVRSTEFFDAAYYDCRADMKYDQLTETTYTYDFSHLDWDQQQIQDWVNSLLPHRKPGKHTEKSTDTEKNVYIPVGEGAGRQFSTYTLVPVFLFTDVTGVATNPTNFTAVANTKRRAAELRWTRPAGAKVGSYAIERRRPDAGSSKGPERAGDSDAFEQIAEISGKAQKFIDATPIDGVSYEYRVAAIVAGQPSYTDGDAAHLPPAVKKQLVPIDRWTGDWDIDLHLPDTTGDAFVGAEIRRKDETGLLEVTLVNKNKQQLIVKAVTSAIAANRPGWTAAQSEDFLSQPEWMTAEDASSPFSIRFQMTPPLDPLDPAAYRTCAGELRFGARRMAFTGTLDVNAASFPHSTLAATAGIGKTTARVGDVVVVVLECATLGPQPVHTNVAAADLTVENGRIVSVLSGDHFRASPADVAGRTAARFYLGAPDFDAKGRSAREKLIVLVEVTSAFGDRQLRCTFELKDVQSEFEPHPDRVSDVQYLQPNPVECAVIGESPAKR